MAKNENEIEARNETIKSLLKDEKYFIDYFQREYRWGRKQINQLIDDLTYTFLKDYDDEDELIEVKKYQNYYLGPIVLNSRGEKSSIIDGQQRITSITLLLIYLNHLQKDSDKPVDINNYIFSDSFGEKSFNLTDEIRNECLDALYKKGEYTCKKTDNETVKNMVKRYIDINEAFPEEINSDTLSFFIYWLIEKVIIIKITAHSDENAYTIFETMNDRGLNLTPIEMLKGYVLSKIKDEDKRNKLNDNWKDQIKLLNEYEKDEDLPFFQAWFRGKYADSTRPGKAGAEDKDYELIGSSLHQWFKDNHENRFNIKTSDDFYNFFNDEFSFFVEQYLMIKEKMNNFDDKMPHLTYIHNWGIADSLQDPLLLASLNHKDNENTRIKKIDAVARFIETFTVRRSVNFKKFGHSSIRYTIFNIVKLIRNNDLNSLHCHLKKEINNFDQNWDGIIGFHLHSQNKGFVKHLLSRITSFVDNESGDKDTNFLRYLNPKGKPFEIEHIWADKYEQHKDEFNDSKEFDEWRNSIGALLLVPSGTNQSYGSAPYELKISHYLKENRFAQTLHESFNEKNPNTKQFREKYDIKPHPQFKKEDIMDRERLIERLCEDIWSLDYYHCENPPEDFIEIEKSISNSKNENITVLDINKSSKLNNGSWNSEKLSEYLKISQKPQKIFIKVLLGENDFISMHSLIEKMNAITNKNPEINGMFIAGITSGLTKRANKLKKEKIYELKTIGSEQYFKIKSEYKKLILENKILNNI